MDRKILLPALILLSLLIPLSIAQASPAGSVGSGPAYSNSSNTSGIGNGPAYTDSTKRSGVDYSGLKSSGQSSGQGSIQADASISPVKNSTNPSNSSGRLEICTKSNDVHYAFHAKKKFKKVYFGGYLATRKSGTQTWKISTHHKDSTSGSNGHIGNVGITVYNSSKASNFVLSVRIKSC